jgi:phosphomannomutase
VDSVCANLLFRALLCLPLSQKFALTLISSISGIRGTIGGRPGDNLTPSDIIRFTTGYGRWLKEKKDKPVVVIGRDARISGEMVNRLVTGTLQALGINVIDLGLSTTPTVEIAVPMEQADGGIILTASHNPKQWNALKLLNSTGEFVDGEDGKRILALADDPDFDFADIDSIGSYQQKTFYIEKHIEKILAHPLVNVEAIKARKFKVVIDCVNSTGGISVPQLLAALGVTDRVELFCAPNGRFPHNPEPLPENLGIIAHEVKMQKADLGIVVDPDVDRLALVTEQGEMFGEEYTLVSIADYVLGHTKGPTVSNLSSTQALKDVSEQHGVEHYQSAVGEVNVVKKMKEVKAVIGGEGNGGIIVPDLHYGRDALAGIALFLSQLAISEKSASLLRAQYPNYVIAKKKIELPKGVDVKAILDKVEAKYEQYPTSREDGLKIIMDKEWVHLRSSNTEPIIRVYAESNSSTTADNIALKLMQDITELMGDL